METLRAWFGDDGVDAEPAVRDVFQDEGDGVARAVWTHGAGGGHVEAAAAVVNGVLSMTVRAAGESCLVAAGRVMAPVSFELRVPDGRRLNIELA